MHTISQMLERARAERRAAAMRKAIHGAITVAIAMVLSAAIGAAAFSVVISLADRGRVVITAPALVP